MKPFTSKHCIQYLTKESPLNQEKELINLYKTKGENKDLLKKDLTDKPKVKIAREPQKLYKDVDGVVRDKDNKDAGHPNPGLSPIKD